MTFSTTAVKEADELSPEQALLQYPPMVVPSRAYNLLTVSMFPDATRPSTLDELTKSCPMEKTSNSCRIERVGKQLLQSGSGIVRYPLKSTGAGGFCTPTI